MKHLQFFLAALFLIGVTPISSAAEVKEIILVFKTHFDIGYTKLASEVVDIYRTEMIDNALDVVDASANQPEERKFVWTIPGWPLAKIVENQTPERAARLDKAIREGRFSVHALPFTLHSETLVEEDWVRGLRFASNINRQYGFDLSTAAKMTDVPCHSWFLPTFLKHSGITFMHEGTNAGSGDPVVPLLYFREGPDGSRVLTMHVNGYGSGIDPPEDWPYQTWLGLIHTGDNHGPPRAEEIDALFKECGEKYPNVKVRIGTLADFGNAILDKEDHAKIPVVHGDMPDTWIHGPMCDPQGQAMARRVHEQLSYLEILNTLVSIQNKEKPSLEFAQKIADAREQSLLYGEHTWGSALYWMCNYGAGEHLPFGDDWKKLWQSQNWSESQKRMLKSWEEHTDYIRNASRILEDCKNTYKKTRFLIFNPLPWEIKNYSGKMTPPGGMESRYYGNGLWLSYKIDEDYVKSNKWFIITIEGKTGRVKSLLDRRSNRELVSQNTETPVGFMYQRASAEMCDKFMNDYCLNTHWDWVKSELGKQGIPSDVPEQRFYPLEMESLVAGNNGSEVSSIAITYKVGPNLPFEKLTLSIFLYNYRPEIEFEFNGKAKQPDTWPEAGYFCFPLNIDNPQFRLGRLGGIMDPAKDVVPGSNRHLQWLRTGMAVYGEDGYGVGICPLDTPLVSLSEPGCWKFSKDFVPETANVYFNLFNNQWTTNFRLWNQGDISASFVLWTFDEYDNESSLITPSLESLALNNQLAVSSDELKPGTRGVAMNRKGIYVTAFGPDVDSGDLMLRFWEMTGKGADDPAVEVQLPEGLDAKTATPLDLRSQPIGDPIPIVDGVFNVDVKPYCPVNLRLE